MVFLLRTSRTFSLPEQRWMVPSQVELILILTVLWRASSPPRGLGASSLFNSLHISDTPPGLSSCEKGRHRWRFHPESDPSEAGKGRRTLQQKRTHQMEIPHLNWLGCLHWPCRALRPRGRLFKIHLHEVSNVEVPRGAAVCEGCCWCKVRPPLPLLSYWFS